MMGKVFYVALSLRSRLVVLVCLATLPAILFTFYIANNERNAALVRMEDDGRHIVSLISREHYYQLSGAKRLLDWLATHITDTASVLTDASFLPALLAGFPQLANIAVVSPQGDVISSAYPLPGNINMHGYEAIRRSLQSHEIEAGTYVIGPIVKRPILHLAYAVRDANDRVLYILFVAIDLKWLNHLTEQTQFPADHILLIFDREGRILASSTGSSSDTIPIGTLIPEFAQEQKDARPIIPVILGGVPQMLAVAPMKGLPGVVIGSGLPYKQLYQKANGVFFRLMGWLSLLTLCTVFFVLFLEEVALIRHLKGLSAAMRRFGQGNFSSRAVAPLGHGELQEMVNAFNTMAETLAIGHRELQDAHDKLGLLARHLQVARESEGKRIARDLHDEVGQVLTSLKMDLSGLQKKCQQCSAVNAARGTIQDDIKEMSGKIDTTVDFIRQISSDLRPPMLDQMGLPIAIEKLAEDVERSSSLAIEVEIAETDLSLSWLISTALYRVVQESLTNIVRHAQASLAQISLSSTEEDIMLVIRDNGAGFNIQDSRDEALGIIGMRERIHLIGGSFFIESVIGTGTTITVKIPRKAGIEDSHENLAG